jgi:hypothetical protein
MSLPTGIPGSEGDHAIQQRDPLLRVASRPPDVTASTNTDETAPCSVCASLGGTHGSNLDDHASTSLNRAPWMAGVAQLVERQVVVLDAVGSSPIARPILPA